MLVVDDPSSIAAYDRRAQKLTIIKVTGEVSERAKLDLSVFLLRGNEVQLIATTTAPSGTVPDWKQHVENVQIDKTGKELVVNVQLYPKSIYTFVIKSVLP
jgi:hypothetical protein